MRTSDLDLDRVYVNSAVRGADYRMLENHFHYYYELFYVQQGSCRFFINDSLYDLRAGDYLVVPPKEVHYNRYFSQCTRINIYFRLSDLISDVLTGYAPDPAEYDWKSSNISESLRAQLSRPCLVHIPGSHRSVFDQLLDQMLREDKLDDAQTKSVLELELRQFFLYSERYCTVHPASSSRATDTDREILDAARFITTNFNLPITLDALAKESGLSPSYFSRRFREVIGMGMKEFLSSVRLKHASIELLSTDHSVTEVALNNGFSDSNYFKDAFKKMYGVSPRAYRDSHTTDSIHKETLTRVGSIK